MKITYSSKIEELVELLVDIGEEGVKELKKIAFAVQPESDCNDNVFWFIRQIPKLTQNGNYYYGFYNNDYVYLFEGEYKDICKNLRKAEQGLMYKLFCPECGCERDDCDCADMRKCKCGEIIYQIGDKYCSSCGRSLKPDDGHSLCDL